MTKLPIFPRDALFRLHAWRQRPQRKPLVIRGARQVGKTVLVRLLARELPRSAELNLGRPEHAALFRRGLSARDIVQAVGLEFGLPSEGEPPLIFLDEIQECPEAVEMLRFLYEDCPEVPVVAAGSLLEVALEAARISFPVGRVEFLHLHPLSFAEFLTAVGEAQAFAAYSTIPTPAYAAEKLQRLFHRYALIGGMPAAVATYAASGGDLTLTRETYAQLFDAYRDDIPKYARNSTLRQVLTHCLNTAPQHLSTRVTFAGFGGSDYRSREVGEALRTLERAMLLKLLYPSTQIGPPFIPDPRKAPRLLFLDAGLVNYRLGLQQQLLGIADLNEAFRGRLLEQLVGQELVARTTIEDATPVFWVRDKPQAQAEVDFLVPTPSGTFPVEVKSGPVGKMRSLHEFMARSRGDLAVRLYAGSPLLQDVVHGHDLHYRLLNLPYWTAGKLPEWIDHTLGQAPG
jgi:predicted AAA+ superfamily ATPase